MHFCRCAAIGVAHAASTTYAQVATAGTKTNDRVRPDTYKGIIENS